MNPDDKIVMLLVACICILGAYLYGKNRGSGPSSILINGKPKTIVVDNSVEDKINEIREKNKPDDIIVVDAPSVDDINAKLDDILARHKRK